MSKTTKGIISEGVFLQWCYTKLNQICKPLEHDLAYDYIAFDMSKEVWIKIQVKSAYTNGKRKSREVGFRRGRSKKRSSYVIGDFDYMFIYDMNKNEKYWIPFEALEHIKSSFTISAPKWTQYKI